MGVAARKVSTAARLTVTTGSQSLETWRLSDTRVFARPAPAPQ
eukprot:COSAG01_NODE_6968_length_3412_cov_229.210383_1_plen_42_part_10